MTTSPSLGTFTSKRMRLLKEKQREAVTLATDKLHNNNQGEANKDNLVLNFEGVPVAGFSDKQKQQLLELIGLFVDNMRQGHAEIRKTSP